jgi:GTP cyclohydrolase I
VEFCESLEIEAEIGTDFSRRPAARPSRHEVEAAVRTLIAATGADPAREGLAETPARVARAYREWFAG